MATNLFRYCATMTYGDQKTQFGGLYVPKFVFHSPLDFAERPEIEGFQASRRSPNKLVPTT